MEKVQKLFARLLVAVVATTAVSTAHCEAVKFGLVLDDHANGLVAPEDQSKAIRDFTKLELVKLGGEVSDKRTGKIYVQVRGTAGKRASRTAGAIPDSWIDAVHIARLDKLKKWNGCWPIEKLVFVDGVVDVQLTMGSGGAGSVSYSEGDGKPHQVVVYGVRDVIDVRDVQLGASYLFAISPLAQNRLSSPQFTVIEQVNRACPMK